MTSLPLFQVDAFTDRPFSGNPAAVCLLDTQRPDEWMRSLAAEMNLSETAFLLPEGSRYRLRWFTPIKEVRLCGHATLASAHVLFETGRLSPGETAWFDTLSGPLSAARCEDWIRLDFPAAVVEPVPAPPGLLAALGIERALFTGKKKDSQVHLVHVETEEELRNLRPDFAALLASGPRAVIVTTAGDGRPYDFISRYFAPQVGINEDPVTGSAHCTLAAYWSRILSKTSFTAYQASARGGVLRVQWSGERVFIEGQAVTVFQGQLTAP